jgi:hypothetical protein
MQLFQLLRVEEKHRGKFESLSSHPSYALMKYKPNPQKGGD